MFDENGYQPIAELMKKIEQREIPVITNRQQPSDLLPVLHQQTVNKGL